MKDAHRSRPYLIVGLGNPGREYRWNRHNAGFLVLDRLAERLGTRFSRLKMDALVTDARFQDEKLILAKPQTFMNSSGKAVRSLVNFFKIPLARLLLVYDDVDLPFPQIRIRPAGGAGGQKGIKSVIQQLGSQEFPRMRIGIDRPPGRMPVSSYVLQDFSTEEREIFDRVRDQAAEAVLLFVSEGIDQAMTEYNS